VVDFQDGAFTFNARECDTFAEPAEEQEELRATA
jgi:hypothetical protein